MNYLKYFDNNKRNSRLLAYFSPERIAEKFYQSEIMQIDRIYDTFFKYNGDKRSQKEVVGLVMPSYSISAIDLLKRTNYFLGNYYSEINSMDFEEKDDYTSPVNYLSKYDVAFRESNIQSFSVIGPFEHKKFVRKYASGISVVDGMEIWRIYQIKERDVYTSLADIIRRACDNQSSTTTSSEEDILAQVIQAYAAASNPDEYMYNNYMSSNPASIMRLIDIKNGEYLFFINTIFEENEFGYMLPYEKFFPITVDRPKPRSRRAAIKANQQSLKNKKIVVHQKNVKRN